MGTLKRVPLNLPPLAPLPTVLLFRTPRLPSNRRTSSHPASSSHRLPAPPSPPPRCPPDMYFVDLKVTLGPSSTNRHQGQAHYGIKRDKMTYVGGITDGFACGGGHTIANRISYNVALDSWSRMCMIDSFHQVNDLFAPPHPAFCVPCPPFVAPPPSVSRPPFAAPPRQLPIAY